ncbi:MAG: MFS transporter [Candidatus Lokiarchaeota archaeon]|nr:MFS transporter [Candidatus Lokiarchaeota archaeon]
MKYVIKGNPTKGIIGSTLGFFIGFTAVVALGATSKFFEPGLKAGGATDAMIGLLVAMPNLSGSLLRIPFAAWSDSIGGKKPMLILLFMAITGLFGLVLTAYIIYPTISLAHYGLLLIFGFLSGCGIATFSVGISQTSYWFKKSEQGKALGLYAGIGNLAPGIFSLIMTITLAFWGLGGSYLLWFIVLVLGTGVYFRIGSNAWSFQLEEQGLSKLDAKEIGISLGQEIFSNNSLKNSLLKSASMWKTWALVGLYFTTFGGFIGLSAWFPRFWPNLYGTGDFILGELGFSIALILNAIFIIIGSLVRVFSGSIADKITGSVVTIIGISILLSGSIMMIFSSSMIILALIAMVLIAIGMGMVNAGVFKMVPGIVPEAVGGAAGWVGGLGALGGFIIPPLMGLFVDIFDMQGYNLGFIIFVILSVICIGIMIILKKRSSDEYGK